MHSRCCLCGGSSRCPRVSSGLTLIIKFGFEFAFVDSSLRAYSTVVKNHRLCLVGSHSASVVIGLQVGSLGVLVPMVLRFGTERGKMAVSIKCCVAK